MSQRGRRCLPHSTALEQLLPSVYSKVCQKVRQKVYVTCCMELHCNMEAGGSNMLPLSFIL